MALNKRSFILLHSAPYGSSGAYIGFFAYVTPDSLATVLGTGYFNDIRSKLMAGGVIDVLAGAGGTPQLARLIVTSAPATGNVTVTVDGPDGEGSAREVVPTSDGLTTGLILATDTMLTVTSGGANDIVTLPAIANVPLGKEIWGKNGGTACEMRTPASSTTKINGGQADSNEAVIAANVSFVVKKTAADNWALLTFTGGAVACPTPD
jgi:hypothetical protein